MSQPVRRHVAAVLACCLAAVTLAGPPDPVSAAPSQPVAPASETTRRSDLRLELVDRSYSGGEWTIVVGAVLNSNAACIPLVFDCIVGAVDVPAGTTLSDTQCLSPLWNHLIVFRDHCLKQVFHAGHDQRFLMTFRTTQQTGDLTLAAEFGRGVLPWQFQRLARGQLVVDLDVALTVTKSCPEAIVASGATFTCTMTVEYPVPPGATPPPITGATLVDTPDPTLFPGGSGFANPAEWSCSGGPPATSCSLIGPNTIDPGETVTFTYTGQAAATATGGTGDNSATLTWTAPLSGSATAVDPITVKGTGDTSLTITKAPASTAVVAGQNATWSVTVTNAGPLPATSVSVTDTAALAVAGTTTALTGVVMAYASGVGTWTCAGATCTAATMPVGSTTFTAITPTPVVTQSATIANEAAVTWGNDILGPSFAEVASSALVASAASVTTSAVPTTTTPRSSVPTRLAFAG
jgi:uncharacterized repeat protein (TIGR01451 family)